MCEDIFLEEYVTKLIGSEDDLLLPTILTPFTENALGAEAYAVPQSAFSILPSLPFRILAL